MTPFNASSSCGFEASWFGASYPDGRCEDGNMWDLDSDGPPVGAEDNPCPRCNTKKFLEVAAEHGGCGTTQSIPWCHALVWERAVEIARRENPEQAAKSLAALSPVITDDWPDRQAVYDGRARWDVTITTIHEYIP